MCNRKNPSCFGDATEKQKELKPYPTSSILHQTSEICHLPSHIPSHHLRINFGKCRSRLGVSSGVPEENQKHSRRIPEGSTAKPEEIRHFSEALPNVATLWKYFYVRDELFFVIYELTINSLAGVAPPPPPHRSFFVQ